MFNEAEEKDCYAITVRAAYMLYDSSACQHDIEIERERGTGIGSESRPIHRLCS